MNIHQTLKFFSLKFKLLLILSFLFSGLLLVLPACNENNGDVLTGTSNESENIGVGFYSGDQADNNLLVLTEAKFLLRKMTLKFDEASNECDVKLGPFVVYLDLTPRVVSAGVAKVPFGVYDAIKFQVHKPSPNENIQDPDFFENTNSRYSVVVRGTYNGLPFFFRSSVTVAKEIEFENHPITVAGIPPVVYITVRVDPYSWFMNNGVFLDPSDENNKHEIDDKIKASLRRAFKDMNLDGNPD